MSSIPGTQSSSSPKIASEFCQDCGYCTATAFPDHIPEAQVRQVVRRVVGRTLAQERSVEGIPVGVSVRHVHLTREHLESLYGPGSELTKKSDLYQPGEFAADETVTLVGPRLRSIQNVRILGPLREYTQVELARTDGVILGLQIPMRDSGDLIGSEPIVIVGPKGSVSLKEGAIRANRHIHMNPEESQRLGVKDEELVEVEVPGPEGLIFRNVKIRVGDSYRLQMHIDTDDANAAGIVCELEVGIYRRR